MKFNRIKERLKEIRQWHHTGLLVGDALRKMAQPYKAKFNFDIGTALSMAEKNTLNEVADLVIAGELIPKSRLDIAVEALEELSKLGNGDRPGNSDGNRIAQQALLKIYEAKS